MNKMSSKYEPLLMLSNRYLDLYLSQKHVDCTFLVDGTTIKCHKLILSVSSPVFEAMLYGPMSNNEIISISDISSDTFSRMIQYIYSGEVDIETESIESVFELYYTAEKYFLRDLVQISLNNIKHKLRFCNILPSLDLSLRMDMQPLVNICINFFNKCCLNELQFANIFKANYYHIEKLNLKLIVKLSPNSSGLSWFIEEWCKNECKNLGLSDADYNLVLNDLELLQIKQFDDIRTENCKANSPKYCMTVINRFYYKACRPFVISETCKEYLQTIQTNRFISLHDITINSRLMPRVMNIKNINSYRDLEYNECLEIQIYTENELCHIQKVTNRKANYNCEVCIKLGSTLILSPGFEYKVKFIWNSTAYGAEYPSNFGSSSVRGITFIDDESCLQNDTGSILKGIKYMNLV